MERALQKTLAMSFLERHRRPPVLVLPNVWDALSARLFAAAGFDALATTSGGVAWALGYPDGEAAPWPDVLGATERIVRCARGPVTADIETGYGETAAQVAKHVAEIIRTGVVGLNLEDGLPGTLRSTDDMVARLAAARQAAAAEGVPIVLNARCDVFHLPHGTANERLAATIERCKAYLAAGADCLYPFGLRDPDLIAAVAKAVEGPVNITGRLGVARITIASAPTVAIMDSIQALASEFRATGSFDIFASKLQRPDVQRLFQPKE